MVSYFILSYRVYLLSIVFLFLFVGDSSVHNQIAISRPYGRQMVKKIRCTNHLLRNFRTKLKTLPTRSKVTGKKVDKSLRTVVENNATRLTTAIRTAVKYRNEEDTSWDQKIEDLKGDLNNMYSHVFGEHKKCKQIGYFKCNPTPDEINYIPLMVECGLYADLYQFLYTLLTHVESLLENKNTNQVECFNSIICKFVGGKRINFTNKGSYEFRCNLAAISFNTGAKFYETLYAGLFTNNSLSLPFWLDKYVVTMSKRIQQVKKYQTVSKYTRKITGALKDVHYGDVIDIVEADVEQTKQEILKKLHVDRVQLEIDTRGQSTQTKWKEARSLRLTASNFGQICAMRESTDRTKRAKTILKGFQGNNATRYGIEHEAQAADDFRNVLQDIEGNEVNFMETGLFVDSEIPYLGASPDRMSTDKSFLVEIKCPSSCENMHPLQGIREKKIKYGMIETQIVDGVEVEKFTLKRNHAYYYQVQGQLRICCASTAYFVIWTKQGLIYDVIQKDDNFWKSKMEGKLCDFYNQHLLPEIIKNY